MECDKWRDRFCVLCTKFSPADKMHKFQGSIREIYDECFTTTSDDFFDDDWVPKMIGFSCYTQLQRWESGKYKLS